VIVLADLQITIIRRMSIAFGDPAWLALAVIVAGVATGVLAGVFGVGGGAIAVPGAVRTVPSARRARCGAHAALHRRFVASLA
jgi:uncharacterized membrane protein YfcA